MAFRWLCPRHQGEQPVEAAEPCPQSRANGRRPARRIDDPPRAGLEGSAVAADLHPPALALAPRVCHLGGRLQPGAGGDGFGPQPGIEGCPVEVPSRPLAANHEIVDLELRASPAAEIALAGAVAPALKAIVQAEPAQQRPDPGRGGFADPGRPARRAVGKKNVFDAGALEGERQGRAGRPAPMIRTSTALPRAAIQVI